MPELTRFLGIIIRMYAEPNVSHHSAHFHAYYQNAVAIYGIDPIELLTGSLPKRQQRLVEAWAELTYPQLGTVTNGTSTVPHRTFEIRRSSCFTRFIKFTPFKLWHLTSYK